MIKDKILQALKTKYSSLGLGDGVLGGIADWLQAQVADEEQIETAVGGVEPMLRSLQGNFDKMRTEKSDLQRQLDALKSQSVANDDNPKSASKPTGNNPAGGPIDQAMASLKAQQEQIKALADRLTKLDEARAQETVIARYSAMAKELGIAPQQKNMLYFSQSSTNS